MRRLAAVRARREAQAAIYDALLFLMVVVLISVGMFLWSVKLVADGPAFTGATYQDLTTDQLVASLGLNIEVDDIYVTCINASGPSNYTLASAPNVSAGVHAVDWALRAYCGLSDWALWYNGTFQVQLLPPRIDAAFARTAVEGTHHGWAYVVRGKTVMWGSDDTTVMGEDDLPNTHWGTYRTLCTAPIPGTSGKLEAVAVVWLYLWLA
jgi:hypothetical protein